jgi:NAD+ synthase
MRDLQARIIADLNVSPTIQPAAEVARRVGFMTDYLRRSGARGLVLGISGGQDSTLAGRICQLAVEALRADGTSARFVAVRLPYGVQSDEDDARLALEFIKPTDTLTFNIKRAVDGVEAEFTDSTGGTLRDFDKGNVKARERMVAQYAIAGDDRLLVELGAPEQLYLKVPTADLLDENPGQTDEANLGLSYRDIDDFLEGADVDVDVAEAIEKRYLATEHKRRVPVSPADGWWR